MYCGYLESKVIDSRSTDEGTTIRRRRECLNCGKRFTTYEKIEFLPIVVIKKDKTRQSFERGKLMNGLIRACEKRPVSMSEMEKVADDIEINLHNMMEREVSSETIGEMVMEHLRRLDEVAYVRFASVYKQFKDLDTFREELKRLEDEK